MIPGVNPRQMRQAMKRMGVRQEEIDAVEVIIRTPEKDLIIAQPQVSKVNMMGQDTWQIVGVVEERSRDTTPTISEEDIQTVADQANVSVERAKQAIEEAEGDLATAILNLGGE